VRGKKKKKRKKKEEECPLESEEPAERGHAGEELGVMARLGETRDTQVAEVGRYPSGAVKAD
jgi:hypothetical protein